MKGLGTTRTLIGNPFNFRVKDGRVMCAWFALCDRPAGGVVEHPIVSWVPTCTEDAARHELELVPAEFIVG